MRTIKVLLTLLIAGAVLAPVAAIAADDVDLLLVLAVDVSRSIDAAKFQLQREGYAAAVADPHVLDAIKSGRTGRVGLTLVEWSGVGAQKVVVDETTLRMPIRPKALAIACLRRRGPLPIAPRSAGPSSLPWGNLTRRPTRRLAVLSRFPGMAPTMPAAMLGLHGEAVAKGITINGLVILSDNPMSWNPDHTNPPGGLANYYKTNVAGGPNAFVMVAENFNSFGQAIIKKMIAEVAQAHDAQPIRAAAR